MMVSWWCGHLRRRLNLSSTALTHYRKPRGTRTRHDPESYIEANIKKMEKRLEHSRKAVEELEMDHLMLQIQNGRMLADLSQTEVEKLKSYASKKITCLERELRTPHPNTSVEPFLEDEGFLNDDEDMETSEGESSESDGADNA
ncbi:unnamed protein product [Brassica napus]|uniref:(rape) hypothetical protein n=1 Tax=Brassica napus TaxID=3708 RepID=A0A817B840_BRANA|nr:unnamed protein product [Brassica napus]